MSCTKSDLRSLVSAGAGSGPAPAAQGSEPVPGARAVEGGATDKADS